MSIQTQIQDLEKQIELYKYEHKEEKEENEETQDENEKNTDGSLDSILDNNVKILREMDRQLCQKIDTNQFSMIVENKANLYDVQMLIKHLIKQGQFGQNDHLNNLVLDMNSSIL